MSVARDLKSIREQIEKRPSNFDNVNERELTRNIESGESRNIRFVQELDPDAEGYDERYGTGLVVSEYQHPDIFWLLVSDPEDDEGEQWVAEQGWKSKLNLYINVVDVDSGDVFYLQRSVLGGLGEQVVEAAGEQDSLTSMVWKVKKTGKGFSGTKYTLTPKSFTKDPLDVDPDDLINFEERVLNLIPSDKQEAHVKQVERRLASKESEAASEAPKSANADDDEDVW